jgi:hypothetical protein
VLWLLVTANIVPSLPILVILMMEAIHSSQMSVITRATWCNIPEEGILHLYDLIPDENSDFVFWAMTLLV